MYTTILAIPNYRLQATDKTVMTFKERAAGQPEALKAWFYPGRQLGSGIRVCQVESGGAGESCQRTGSRDADRTGSSAHRGFETAPVEAVAPTGEVIELAQVVEPPPMLPASKPPAPCR